MLAARLDLPLARGVQDARIPGSGPQAWKLGREAEPGGEVEGDPEEAAFSHTPTRGHHPGTAGPAGSAVRGLVRWYKGWPGEEARASVPALPPSSWVTLVKFLCLNFSSVK